MAFGSPPHPTSLRAELEGLTILAVEDHLDSLELLTEALQSLGATVFPASTSREAFELLLEHHPHLVISDIGLPDEDGFSLMRRIRQLSPDQGGHTPAIAVSAFTAVEDRKRALAAGFQAFVPKPMELTQLTRSIRTLSPSATLPPGSETR
jgi:CheY-like chemotaxis protein